jgi:hypothetical protein
MRGRNLLGLSNANRQAAGVVTGDEVEVDVELDTKPRVVVEPAGLARALNAGPVARAAFDRLTYGHKLQPCALSRARRSLRRAYGGSRKPWRCYGTAPEEVRRAHSVSLGHFARVTRSIRNRDAPLTDPQLA